ncbi:MAG TPA: glycosyltransferase [Caproicibacter sp.]|nr:glycosyltransferase [Caproicibacter sp.]
MLLSLCMIVKDEEENLEKCLKSVKNLADETIIIDTGSTDRTVEIAEGFGAKVLHFAWNDNFAEARNYSLSFAQGDWILVMDADDELEPGGIEKIIGLLQKAGKEELFCCKTLCYLGDQPDTGSILINMNIRLIRNNKGYRFSGRIHEQIASCDGGCPCVHAADICFYHYGYLKDQIERKDKHRRNIGLILKELNENPENAYMLFCMGNEYLATMKATKALTYYRKSLLLTSIQAGYRSALLVRMILCCDQLRLSREMNHLIEEGIHSYPNLTDFLFFKACALQRGKKLESAIRCYKKCIRMGDPPLGSNSTMGISTYQAQYSISIIYSQMGEYEKALRYCRAAVKSSPRFRDAVNKLLELLLAKEYPSETLKNKMTRLVPKDFESYLMLSDIFYNHQLYDEALCLCRRAKRLRPGSTIAIYDEGVCKFYLQQYEGASRCFSRIKDGSLAAKAAWYQILCFILGKGSLPRTSRCKKLLETPYYETATECFRLIYEEAGKPFTEKNPQKYQQPVYNLLETLLGCGETQAFQKSLPLLSRIGDPASHLQLGKLYYKYGYEKSAYYELIRSIRKTGQIDAEGLSILKKTYSADYKYD